MRRVAILVFTLASILSPASTVASAHVIHGASDILNFTNYLPVCGSGCPLAPVAQWEQLTQGAHPSLSEMKGLVVEMMRSHISATNPSSLWSFWKTHRIGGAYLSDAKSIPTNESTVEIAIHFAGVVMTNLNIPAKSLLGGQPSTSNWSGLAVAVGTNQIGPMVVLNERETQMSWSQWRIDSRQVWELITSPQENIASPARSLSHYTVVTFDANGGNGSMNQDFGVKGTSVTLPTNNFTFPQETFVGWNTLSNGKGTEYAPNATYTYTKSTTLYAQWVTGFLGTTSSNWSGYSKSTTSNFTYASGSWTVPALNCSVTPNGNVSTWVGIGVGGSTSDPILQAGVDNNCSNGTQQNYSWWEIYPGSSVDNQVFIGMPISSGDKIVTTISQNQTTKQWIATVQDQTNGLEGVMQTGGTWSVDTISNGAPIAGAPVGDASSVSYPGGWVADWIIEAPQTSAGKMFTLADYGTETLTGLATSQSLFNMSGTNSIEMNQGGVVVSTPSLFANGSFTATYSNGAG